MDQRSDRCRNRGRTDSLTVAGFSAYLAQASRRIEQVRRANQTVVTHRLDVFAKLAPGLNRLLYFATFVDGWKEILPGQTITPSPSGLEEAP